MSDGSYSISDIEDYFENIKKHETTADNPPVQIYVNKIKNRIVFKNRTGCKLESLSSETRRLLGGTKKDVDQDKDGDDVSKLESLDVVSAQCNLVNNNYQQASKELFTFVPNKQFGKLITMRPHSSTKNSLTIKHKKNRLSIHYTMVY